MGIETSGPVYIIAQREAVERDGEAVLVIDPGFITTKILADGSAAVLLYSTRELAEEFLAKMKDVARVVATFKSKTELAACLRQNAVAKNSVVLLDFFSEQRRGHAYRIEDVIERLDE